MVFDSIRLLLATVAAKQVKARKMLADLSTEFTTALADSETTGLQQLQELTARLQQAHQQVAAAQADAEQQRKAAAQQAELTQLRENELKALRAELKALRKTEARHRAELHSLHERLLEKEAAVSRLSGALPGASKSAAAPVESMSDDSSAVADSTAAEAAVDAGEVSSREAAGGLFATPVSSRQHSRTSQGAGAGVGGSMGGVSIMTPDQAAAAELRSWLSATQTALMETEERALAREAEVRQLKEQIKQLKQQQQPPQDGQQQDQEQQELENQQLQQPQEQEQLEELQAAVDASAAAAAAASSERDVLSSELSDLRAELAALKSQLDAADSARSAAIAALEEQQRVQQQAQAAAQEEPQQQSSSEADAVAAVAAAERASAAEAELQKALAAAAEAAAEVESLQQQLKVLQQQAAQPASPEAPAALTAGAEESMAGPSTPDQATATAEGSSDGSSNVAGVGSSEQQMLSSKHSLSSAAAAAAAPDAGPAAAAAEGQGTSPGFELLQANSRIHVLQEELHDTQDSMRLLLKLVKKCASSAAGAALKYVDATAMSAAAASALSGDEQQQLHRMLSGVSDASAGQGQAPDAVSTAPVEPKSAAAAAADVRLELGLLHGLLHKLECRYSTPKHLQDAILRGREMEHLLCTALQQVHAIKAEARGGPCACPSEQDYLHPVKAAVPALSTAAAAAAGGAPDAGLLEDDPAAAAGGALQQQQQQQQQQEFVMEGLPGVDGPAEAEAGFEAATHSGNGWLQSGAGEGYGMASESSLSAGGYSSYEASGVWEGWQTSGGGAALGGSCGGDAMRGFSSNSGAGQTAGSSFGGAAAAAGGGGLAPLADENLGYDGLEGAWWAKSAIDQPVTELPDFLVKKT